MKLQKMAGEEEQEVQEESIHYKYLARQKLLKVYMSKASSLACYSGPIP